MRCGRLHQIWTTKINIAKKAEKKNRKKKPAKNKKYFLRLRISHNDLVVVVVPALIYFWPLWRVAYRNL